MAEKHAEAFPIEAFYTGGLVELCENDGHLLCTNGSAVCKVDIDSGRTVRQFEGDDNDALTSFSASPDGEWLVTCSQSLLVRQWRLADESAGPSHSWRLHGTPVSASCFDPSSTLFAIGTTKGVIQVWDVLHHHCTHNVRGAAGVVSVVVFHPSRLLLFAAGSDNIIRVMDLKASGRCVAQLDKHVSTVTCLAFVNGGRTLLSGARDQLVHVWSLPKGKRQKTIPVYEEVEAIVSLDESENFPGCDSSVREDDEVCFMTGGNKGLIRVLTVSGKELYTANATQQRVKHLLHQRSNQSIAMVTFSQTISILELTRSQVVTKKHLVGYHEDILDATYVGDSHLVALATNSEELRLLDTDSQNCDILTGHSDIIMAVSSSPDGSWLATCSKDQSVRVWSRDKHGKYRCAGLGRGHTGPVGAVACNRRQQSSAFLVSGSKDCTIKVWEFDPCGEKSPAHSLAVRYTQLAHQKDINSVAVSPNDKFVASGSADRTAKLWNSLDGSLVGVLSGHRRGVWCVVFSPVDKCLATASSDATVRLWSLTDFSVVRMFEGHAQSVLRVVFLSSGTELMSAGGDGLLKVWNVRTGDCTTTLDKHDDRVWALCLDAKEEQFVSGGSDSTLLVWTDRTQKVQDERFAAQEQQVLQEQELSNLLDQKQFDQAVSLALTLDQPFRLHGIIMKILESDGEKSTISPRLAKVIRVLGDDQVSTLLRFASVWNTNARHSRAAQAVLRCLLEVHLPDHLATLCDDELCRSIESFLPYSQRHLQRVLRLLQQASFLAYSWEKMKEAR